MATVAFDLTLSWASCGLALMVGMLTYHSAAIKLHHKQSTTRTVAGGKMLILGYEFDIRHVSVAILVFEIFYFALILGSVEGTNFTNTQCILMDLFTSLFFMLAKYFCYLFILLRARVDQNIFTRKRVNMAYIAIAVVGITLTVGLLTNIGLGYDIYGSGGYCYSTDQNLHVFPWIIAYIVADVGFGISFLILFVYPITTYANPTNPLDTRLQKALSKIKFYSAIMLISTPGCYILYYIILYATHYSYNGYSIAVVFVEIEPLLICFCIIKQFQREHLRVVRYMVALVIPGFYTDEELYINNQIVLEKKEEETTKVEQTYTGNSNVVSLSSGLFRGIASSQKDSGKKKDEKDYDKMNSPSGDLSPTKEVIEVKTEVIEVNVSNIQQN